MKRRTHQGAGLPTVSKDPNTGEIHLRHRAYKVGEDLYYKGRVVVSGTTAE